MGSVKDFPVEILCDIFRHLKRKIVGVKSPEDIKIIKLANQDVFECQLVCKKWMRPAQQIIYKEIYIKGLQQLIRFSQLMNSSNTPPPSLMTETVLIDPQNDIVFFASFFMTLALLCPKVKKIHSVQIPSNYFWSVLMRERYEGHLQALEVVPPVNATKLACVLHYELAAWSLYETLTHLDVFDWLPIPGKNITRLNCFENLKSLKLNLEDFRYIFGLDQSIHDRLESIDIELKARGGTTLPKSDKPVDLAIVTSFPNVKYLNARNMVTNDTVVSYLMRMLPCLKDLIIVFSSPNNLELSEIGKPRFKPLSTKVGIQLLEYLNRIPSIYIDNVCVQDPLGIMAGFFEKSLDALEFEYNFAPQEEELPECISYLTFAARDETSHARRDNTEWAPIAPVNDKTRFKTVVTFEVLGGTEILPHMEMVEYFGHVLKTLSLDFGENFDDDQRNDEGEYASNGQYLNHILQHCSQLKHLQLEYTNLERCEFDVPLGNRFLDGGDLSFKGVVIHSSVLEQLTNYVPKLSNLSFTSCIACYGSEYPSGAENGIIHMKSTSVSTVCWASDEQVYSPPFNSFFLKLNIGAKTYYYAGSKSNFRKSAKIEFDEMLGLDYCLCLSFSFKGLDCININTFDFSMKISAYKGSYRLEETYPITLSRPQKPLYEDSDIDFDSDTS